MDLKKADVPGRNARFRSDIEGLRAVAVLLVVADHLFSRPSGGFIGVDVFFVISGYLITGLLVREGERKQRISIREFYARRARRILPIALLVLIVTDVAARWVFLASRAHETFSDSLWALGFVANVHFSRIGTNYFQSTRPASPIQHFWSLSVEEQFYLVWPWLLITAFFFARRRGLVTTRRYIGFIAAAATVASFVWCQHVTHFAPTAAYFSTPARAWELGVGCTAAICQPLFSRIVAPVRLLMAWAGLGGIAVATLVIGPTSEFPGYVAALPVLSTMLVLVANNPFGGVGGRFALGNAIPQYIGRLSYSLYLWHWPCIILASGYFASRNLGFYATALILPFVLSATSFHFLEDPIRHSRWLSKRRPGQRRPTLSEWQNDNRKSLDAALVLLTGLVVIGVAFSYAGSSGSPPAAAPQALSLAAPSATGAPATPLSRLQAAVAHSLTVTKWGALSPSLNDLPSAKGPQWDTCGNVDTDQALSACTFGPASAAHTAVVIGDSYAISYLPGIIAALRPHGWRVEAMTFGECPNALVDTYSGSNPNAPYQACISHRQWAISHIRSLKPDLVVMADASYLLGHLLGKPASPEATWETGSAAMVSALRQGTQHIVILAGPPSSGNLQTCVTKQGGPSNCESRVQPAWFEVQDAERAAAARQHATYVNTLNWFCSNDVCPAVVNSTPVYWDGSHLTDSYSTALAPLMAPALLQQTKD
jgi:peptidoglycan/LPS O-acetylase OafA/YrhL